MERSSAMAAPKEDHKIRLSGITEARPGTWRVSYSYEGTLVIQSGPRTRYSFPLPVNPTRVYAAAMNGSRNPCTDKHYQAEEDFWYFWSPAGWGVDEFPRCKLRSNENGTVEEGEDYEIVTGAIRRLEKDRTTYPEYDRLAVDKVIDAHFFYGKDEPGGKADPYRSRDLNARAYREVASALRAMGFTLRRWSEKEIHAVVPARVADGIVFVEEAVKSYPNGLRLRARIFFGETGIDEASTGFHYFFRDALRNASVMVYNGHSGLGGHLDLKAIADLQGFRVAPNPNRYQIYFFNSCTSYTYYNTTYFNRKRGRNARKTDPSGTKNLDILANGLATAFEVMHETDMALLRVIDGYAARGTWTSYQRLARAIDSDNLFTVNGDEDNPTKRR